MKEDTCGCGRPPPAVVGRFYLSSWLPQSTFAAEAVYCVGESKALTQELRSKRRLLHKTRDDLLYRRWPRGATPPYAPPVRLCLILYTSDFLLLYLIINCPEDP